jgi:hypothetical protein
VGVPAKKWTAFGPLKGMICAELSPCIRIETSGTTTPRSIRSVTPNVA